MTLDLKQIGERVERESGVLKKLVEQIRTRVVGQEHLVRSLLTGLLCNGHVLLEGVPGLAKTLSVSSLAGSIKADYQRIQFTPDLLPADIIGTQIYSPNTGDFSTRKGPVFSNLVLADEINRAPAKVQSALLEAMQERQVTIGEETFDLPELFLVLATQNPIEQEGTYPLPEAQVDRFLLKVKIDYPSRSEEREILDLMGASSKSLPPIESVITPEEILRLRELVDDIYTDDKIKEYIVDIVHATRNPQDFNLDLDSLIDYGASPRATLALTKAARAHAFLEGNHFVAPQDVKAVAMDVLRHRVVLTYEAEAEELSPEDVVQRILDGIKVP